MAPLASFEELFARPHDARTSAPVPVTLLGDGADDGGRLLACTLGRETVVEIAHRDDDVVEVATTSAPDGHARLSYRVGDETPSGAWLDHVMGVTTALRAAGLPAPGMSLRIDGDVAPVSASCAPVVVALLRAVRALTGSTIDDVAVARLAHAAEHDFVGAPFAVGEALACSLGRSRDALVIDTRTLGVERLALPARAALVVIDAGIEDAGPLRRRARHAVTEDARVLAAADALRRDDPETLGRLLAESHRSLREDHQVPLAVDALVECAEAQAGCHGARLGRGGSAATMIALVDRRLTDAVTRSVLEAAARGGATARVVLPAA